MTVATPRLGFQTVGNATLIAYDDSRPVLVTDPWITGSAYFGSWSLSHEIKPEQREAILSTKYAWISHGHPDHLSPDSLALMKKSTLLVPDHYGGRIAQGLTQDGFKVQILEDQKWTALSENVRVFCIATDGQDAILLVALKDQTILLNTNDTGHGPWVNVVRRESRPFAKRFLMCASGFGDICGINYYGEDGKKLLTPCELRKAGGFQVGKSNSDLARVLGANHFVPFSSMHQYQRADSVWANEFLTELDDHKTGFDSSSATLLPPYISYDCGTKEWRELKPAKLSTIVQPPETFGDNWSDQLEKEDEQLAASYFRAIQYLPDLVDFVRLRVGGRETMIELNKRGGKRGLTLETPRGSLVTALKYEIYEDLVLGNFMKITLNGGYTLDDHSLDFITHVARFADNGQVKDLDKLALYRARYRKRTGRLEALRFQLEQTFIKGIHRANLGNSALYRKAKEIYLQNK